MKKNKKMLLEIGNTMAELLFFLNIKGKVF